MNARGLFAPGRRTLIVGLVLTITLTAFEVLAISTVMPIVARELGGIELYGWVFTAFFLGSLLGIVLVGGAIDGRGLGPAFAVALGLFAVGLAIGGLAPSMAILVAARFLQGLGAGAIQPLSYVAIGRRLPEVLRPRMFALLSMAWVLPALIGPALAGLIGETIGWRVIFLGLLPILAVAAITTYPAIRGVTAPPDSERGVGAGSPSVRARVPLAFVVTVGAALLTGGLTSGEPLILVAACAAGLAIGVPALRRLTPPGTLRAARGIPAAILIRGILTFSFFAVDAYVALVLVEVRGQAATQAGVALTAATLAWSVGAWAQARWARRFGPEWFVTTGFSVAVVGLGLFAFLLLPAVPVWAALPAFGLAGLGMGLGYAPLSLIVLRDVPAREQGSATSALSLTDALGTALGTGATGAVVAMSIRASGEPSPGLAAGFLIAVAAGLAGILLTRRLRVSTAGHGTPSPDRDPSRRRGDVLE